MLSTRWTREKLWHALGVPGYAILVSAIVLLVSWLGEFLEVIPKGPLSVHFGREPLTNAEAMMLLLMGMNLFVWFLLIRVMYLIFPTPKSSAQDRPKQSWHLNRIGIFFLCTLIVPITLKDNVITIGLWFAIIQVSFATLYIAAVVCYWIWCVGRNGLSQFIVRLPFGLSQKFDLKDHFEQTEMTDDEKLDAFLATSASLPR